MTVITAEKLSACVGAQVVGADVDRLLNDDALPAWVLETLERHGALVFRGVHIDDTTQVAFSKKLGRVEVFGKGVNPEIFRVTLDPEKNRAAPYLRGTFDWHIDGCTEDVPIMATILCAHAVAEKGGETEFASTYAAFEDLDDELKDRCLALRVVHTLEAAQRLTITEPTPEELATWRARPAKVHPLVWTHQTGRKSLVLGATASHIEGLEAEESRALLDGLLAHSTGPERIYRHQWEVGDMVIWDNRGVLHRACRYDAASPRDMHRTTLHGDEPIQ
jgi:alpha-ketoglutarate-dependent taurine dioxygenase